jgi:hypothetical protein
VASRDLTGELARRPVTEGSVRTTLIIFLSPGFDQLLCLLQISEQDIWYRIFIVRYDFPLRIHVWSFDAAVYARWFQDKVSLSAANDDRASVFASQQSIGVKEDLQSFTRTFATDHKVQLPFVIDPAGDLANKIRSDYALGTRLNVTQAPAIIVVTAQHYQQITCDPHDICAVIEEAIAQTKLK